MDFGEEKGNFGGVVVAFVLVQFILQGARKTGILREFWDKNTDFGVQMEILWMQCGFYGSKGGFWSSNTDFYRSNVDFWAQNRDHWDPRWILGIQSGISGDFPRSNEDFGVKTQI